MIRETALITGATGGLGRAFALHLAALGHELVLVARDEDKLTALADEIRARHDVLVRALVCDLGVREQRDTLLAQLTEGSGHVDLLINNAGFAAYGPFTDTTEDRLLGMVSVNIEALTHLTRALLPEMVRRHRGSIVNVASTAAFQPIPNMAVYAATKAYVQSLSEALWTECKGTGVKVIALCPGPTETGFWDVADAQGVMTDRRAPEQVVATCFDALEKGKPFVVDGMKNTVLAGLSAVTPYRVVGPITQRITRRRG